VLRQDAGAEEMQIEVVDDCSPSEEVAALVRRIAGDRVGFHRSPLNRGLAGAWNYCVERSRGQWVHILHQDDYILPGFYQRLALAAESHPQISLLATRSFFVDSASVIMAVTRRLPQMEHGSQAVDGFFYGTPIQCPGIVVKKSFYEEHGGFRTDLNFTLDCEMWARVVGLAGGLVAPEVLACYRTAPGNETGRLARTAENLRDLERLNRLFAERYPGFDAGRGRQRVCDLALHQAGQFLKSGEAGAAQANLDFWKSRAPVWRRLRRTGVSLSRNLCGWPPPAQGDGLTRA
jgi:glycosyltransferase involved in cell wall biosynthesis